MLPITFAALCVAVISAESSSVSSYSSNPSNTQYEYSSGSYLSGKPSYSDLGSGTYISTGSSPYAKSDSRYTSDTSGDSSSDPARTSLASSYYKTKYGSEAVVNSLRPSTYHQSGSASGSGPASSSSSAELSSSQQQPSSHYSSSEYTSSSGHPSSSTSAAYYASQAGGGGGSGSAAGPGPSGSSEYSTTGSFSYERQPSEQQQQQHQQHQQHHQTVYASAAEAIASAQAADYVPTRSAYSGYSGSSGLPEYAQTRPSAYSHSGLGSPISSLSSSEYPVSSGSSGPHHHHHHPQHHPAHQHSLYSFNDEYPSAHAMSQSQPQPHAYKTYVMSSGPGGGGGGGGGGPSSYPSKYQSVFGAIKSLFTGGSLMPDASPSATHVSSYPSSASGPSSAYYSPGAVMQSHGSGHHGPSAMSSGGPGYYFSSGPGASSSPYAKQSYGMPMRFTSGYGGPAVGGASPGSKIIVIRDSGSGHSSAYPSSGAGLIASPSSYAAAKSKISAFAPGAGPSYLSASPPSSLGYSGGPISSGYPSGGYSSGGFGGGHGGSTFLGYSA